jgi:hypothetical protein
VPPETAVQVVLVIASPPHGSEDRLSRGFGAQSWLLIPRLGTNLVKCAWGGSRPDELLIWISSTTLLIPPVVTASPRLEQPQDGLNVRIGGDSTVLTHARSCIGTWKQRSNPPEIDVAILSTECRVEPCITRIVGSKGDRASIIRRVGSSLGRLFPRTEKRCARRHRFE